MHKETEQLEDVNTMSSSKMKKHILKRTKEIKISENKDYQKGNTCKFSKKQKLQNLNFLIKRLIFKIYLLSLFQSLIYLKEF